MGVRYVVPIDAVAIGTAVQDIFSLKSSATNGIIIHWIHLDSTNSAAAALRLRLKRGTATITQGSGGSVITPPPLDINETLAAGTVAHINDTSQATTNGAFTALFNFNWDTVLPFDFLPPPEDRPQCTISQGFFLDLPAVIVAATISGFMVFEEAR
jgi:hypothetical protein